MLARNSLNLRRLPDGPALEIAAGEWKGSDLFLPLADRQYEFPIGALVEVEDGPVIYLGEIQEWRGFVARISVEHSVDRAKLAGLSERWK